MAKRGRKISVHPPPLTSPPRGTEIKIPCRSSRSRWRPQACRELEYEKGAQPLLGRAEQLRSSGISANVKRRGEGVAPS